MHPEPSAFVLYTDDRLYCFWFYFNTENTTKFNYSQPGKFNAKETLVQEPLGKLYFPMSNFPVGRNNFGRMCR